MGERFDLVLLDLTVSGGIGGEQIMKEIRNMDSKVIGIVSSGYADNPILANPQKYGFAARLTKPYLIEDLAKVINSLWTKERR